MQGGSVLLRRLLTKVDQHSTGVDKQTEIRFRPGFIQPMLSVPVKKLPEGPSWEYELKLDGYRALGLKTEGGTRLYSRNGKDFWPDFRASHAH